MRSGGGSTTTAACGRCRSTPIAPWVIPRPPVRPESGGEWGAVGGSYALWWRTVGHPGSGVREHGGARSRRRAGRPVEGSTGVSRPCIPHPGEPPHPRIREARSRAPHARTGRWVGTHEERQHRERPGELPPHADRHRGGRDVAGRLARPGAAGLRLPGRRDELGHRGQARGGAHRDHRAARGGPPARRGRAGRRQDARSPRRWPARSTARSAGCSSPPTCCRATSPVCRSSTRTSATSSSGPAPIFANVVIGDEINRASPKTQSALLESMEEAPGHGRRRTPTRCPARSW